MIFFPVRPLPGRWTHNYLPNRNLSMWVTWPHLNAGGLKSFFILGIFAELTFWLLWEKGSKDISRQLVFVTFFLTTCSIFYERLVVNWPFLPSWSILGKTMKLKTRITLVFGKHLSNHFVPSVWLLLPQISSLNHIMHQCGTLTVSGKDPKLYPIPLSPS